jgi:hypothetical protein
MLKKKENFSVTFIIEDLKSQIIENNSVFLTENFKKRIISQLDFIIKLYNLKIEEEQKEKEELKTHIVSAFYENGIPQFTQGVPTHELQEPLTAIVANTLINLLQEKDLIIAHLNKGVELLTQNGYIRFPYDADKKCFYMRFNDDLYVYHVKYGDIIYSNTLNIKKGDAIRVSIINDAPVVSK